MSNPDDDLFALAMGTVKPLKAKEKVSATKKAPAKQQVLSNQTSSPFPSAKRRHRQPIKITSDTLLANGVSQERLKRLAAGDPPVDQELDLHGMFLDNSLEQLEETLASMLHWQQRVLCIVHGRGLHSQDQKPVLKNAILNWLHHGPVSHHILAVIPAPGSRGGSSLVLLRRQRN